MQRALRKNRFAETVSTILEQHNEDKAFKMYLAYSSNMMNEPVSFSDYLNGLKGNAVQKPKAKTNKNATNKFMTEKEAEKFIEKCNLELKNFTPPSQKGGI